MLYPRTWGSLLAVGFAAVACGADETTSGTGNNTTGSNTTTSQATSTGAGAGGGTTSSTTSSSSSTGPGGSPGGEVRIIATGDTGEGNTEQHCVADAMNAKCAATGCDAVLLSGDNFYEEGVSSVDDPQWLTKFEQPYDRQTLNMLKFYVVLGNHDYAPPPFDLLTNSNGDRQSQIDYSFLPVGTGAGHRYSDKWLMPDSYYDVQLGNGLLHIFGVDSQDTSDTQLNDMQGRVAASTATWKLAFAHHPRYTSGDHQGDNDLLNTVSGFDGPSMYELQQAVYCNTDIYLCGHDHNREFIDKGMDSQCPNTHFIISGAGAKVRESAFGTVQNSLYYNEDIEGFFYFIFTPTSLTVESYDMDAANCAGAGTATPAWTKTINK